MPRALDHLVLPCPDLAEAAYAFEALGFLVGERNRHPWGTENHIVQMPGVFLELIARAPEAGPLAPEDDAFPFAGFLAGQGASAAPSGMIVLPSDNAGTDAETFIRRGVGAGRMLHFSRSGMAPDGAPRTVAFSLAFATAATMPDVGFFVCQQHHPENFWNAAMQHHPNGVTGVATVTMAGERPEAHGTFLAAFADASKRATTAGGVAVALEGDAVLEIEPAPGPVRLAALRFRADTPAPSARFGALQLRFG